VPAPLHLTTVIVVCRHSSVIFVCLTNKRQELFAASINQYIDAKYNTCYKHYLQFVCQAVNLRANSGNAGPTVSITGLTTGIFNNNTNTYSATPTDAINYKIITASTGTSMKIAFIAVWGNSELQVKHATTYSEWYHL